MRVNSRVFNERADLLGGIKITNCPSQFRSVAERLVMMAMKPGYSRTDYNNVTQLDKILIVDYWQEYDGLILPTSDLDGGFKAWFIHQATSPDLISRSVRWLVSHNYFLLKPEVLERAMEASNRWRQAVSQDK